MADNDPTPSTTGVLCRIGSKTVRVDTPGICSDLGGTIPDPEPPKGCCGGCGKDIAQVAIQLRIIDFDAFTLLQKFNDRIKLTREGKRLSLSFMKADKFMGQAIQNNPEILGSTMMAMVATAQFVQQTLDEKSAFDSLIFPKIALKYLQRSAREIRKSNLDFKFLEALDELNIELRKWSKASVADIRALYLSNAN